MKVLLLSAYAAQSHVFWQNQLLKLFPDWQWRELSLPPRHFAWRMRGNPLYWSVAERATLEEHYDLLVATSMVDLATLRGLVPNLATIPTILYFHENQFAYPERGRVGNLLEAQMVSLYSAIAADSLLFNSRYNHDSFMEGCQGMLAGFPDKVPKGIVESLRQKSAVVPVPLERTEEGVLAKSGVWPAADPDDLNRPIRITWIGRFEFDKGGDGLLLTLRELEKTGLNYSLAVIGQRFRNSPAAFATIEEEFGHLLVQFGYVEKVATYRQILSEADIILSTALHEFQGLAVLEAVGAGCIPVVPGRLVYPEIFSEEFLYTCDPRSPGLEARNAAQLLATIAGDIIKGTIHPPDVSEFEESRISARYRIVFEAVIAVAAR